MSTAIDSPDGLSNRGLPHMHLSMTSVSDAYHLWHMDLVAHLLRSLAERACVLPLNIGSAADSDTDPDMPPLMDADSSDLDSDVCSTYATSSSASTSASSTPDKDYRECFSCIGCIRNACFQE